MMQRTHLAIVIFFILIFLPFMNHKITFAVFALIASILPDIDSETSKIGNKWYLRPFQFFTKHRGMVHSLSICLLVSLFFALFIPILAFPIFLGYACHLLSDSLTLDGIQPFWPLNRRSQGWIKTNSSIEHAVFLSFILLNILILADKILGMI